MNPARQYLGVLLLLLSTFIAGCTETVHASIWVETFPAQMDSRILQQAFTSLGWREDSTSTAGEVVFRNPSLPSCYLRQGPAKKLPIEIVFVKVGADHFGPAEAAAYRRLAIALATALGDSSIRAENIDGKA